LLKIVFQKATILLQKSTIARKQKSKKNGEMGKYGI
jgi:hypothetical protein